MSDITNPNNDPQVVTNPATQTLFRFVSLRNPQLADKSEKNLGFITRPNGIGGIFDTQIENWASHPKTTIKFQELEAAATIFEKTAFTREKDVENLNSDYYKLGKSLANDKVLDQELLNRLINITDKINNTSLSSLWNNLIYQVVTQKNFYIKEAIIQTLKAVHYVEVYKKAGADKLKENTNQAKNAKVVLPAKLFVEDAPVEDEDNIFTVDKTVIGSEDKITGGSNAARIIEGNAPRSLSVLQESRLKLNAKKNLQGTTALLKKDMMQSLKIELEKLKKSYNKAYTKAYNNAYAEYREIAQPIIDSNNDLIEDLEATFDENTTEAAKKAAYKQLVLAEVPKFEFTYKNEINFTDLQAKLTPESFNIFLELFTEYDAETITNGLANRIPQNFNIISDTEASMYNTTVTLSDDYASYTGVFAKLNEEVSEQSKTVLSTVEMPKQQYVNLGGALVPVANNVGKTPRAYVLQALSQKSAFSKLNSLYFSFEVESNSWSVAYAKVSAETGEKSIEQSFNNLSVVNDKITFPSTFVNQFEDITSLKIELYFDNSTEAVLEFDELTINQIYTGIFDFTSTNTNVAKTSGSSSSASFTPQHFGVKRLGIADYLKVEQSIHAYVPGEVSNIENVMASELRHKSSVARDYSEITDTTSKSQETEKMSDTSKTSRTDMQTEVAKELERQQNIEAHTSFSYNKGYKFEIGGSYANSTAQHDSTRQAVAKSQEITERAMERVLTKVSEERIQKIIKEYTETNVHEFDNRGQAASTSNLNPARPQHITGVYRWVDKKMKNQIYNYGKRTMFEFMIPEPARLHKLAMKSSKDVLTAPQDPRTAPAPHTMINAAAATDDLLTFWAKEYDVQLTETLPEKLTHRIDDRPYYLDSSTATQFQVLDIPKDYAVKSASVYFEYEWGKMKMSNFKGGFFYYPDIVWETKSFSFEVTGLNIEEKYLYEFQGTWVNKFKVSFNLMCEPSDTYLATWRKTNFDKIIEAYNVANKAFQDSQAAADAQVVKNDADNKEKVSLYYRDMEAEVLKHNCIAYLLQDYGALGAKDLYGYDKAMQSFYVKFGKDLDAYTSLAKFMEQAMEWSIMDYTFYPYYWADSKNWQEMYLSSDVDPLFRNFLQAGMARVIVTVKPGFEDAVNFFMTTGRIWNGGEVPVIGDPMYLSIVEELRQPTGKPQGNYWITRVPTALTILQAGSAGLKVDDALPIFKEDHPEECENPLELESESAFRQSFDAIMQHGEEGSTLG